MDTKKPEVKAGTFMIDAKTWGDKKTKLKNKHSELTDADLKFEKGQESELTGRLVGKLKKTKEEVHAMINKL